MLSEWSSLKAFVRSSITLTETPSPNKSMAIIRSSSLPTMIFIFHSLVFKEKEGKLINIKGKKKWIKNRFKKQITSSKKEQIKQKIKPKQTTQIQTQIQTQTQSINQSDRQTNK